MQIQMTDAAKVHIEKIVAAASEPSVFRLALKKSGCSGFRYDPQIVPEPQATDIKLEISPAFFIYVQADTEQFYDRLTIDLVEKFLGHQLIFLNPNAEDECGCGESFNLKDKS